MADCTPQALAAAASCLRCLPKRRPVRTYLLCQWANNLCDPDAQAFLDAAGVTSATQIAAICKLVVDLKSGGGATRYWDRDILIYPFVGPNINSYKVNLKTPGTHDLSYRVVPPIYSANGIQGNGVAGQAYAMTDYLIPAGMQNNVRAFWYLDQESSVDGRYYFGCATAGANPRFFGRTTIAGNPPISFSCNDATTQAPYVVASPILGAWVLQRKVAASDQISYGATPFLTSAVASIGVPNNYLYLLVYNNTAAPPNGDPVTFSSDCRLSSFSLGTPFADDADWQAYRAIWETFETSLGRAH